MLNNSINELTEIVIGCAFNVSNTLGAGFLEKVYENALKIEILKNQLNVVQQCPIKVYYENQVVGDYIADLIINDEIIIELKVAKNIDEIHQAQLLNYLKATRKKLGLIINFGNPKVEIKRMINSL